MKKYFKLDDIHITVYVRKEASQERIQYFAELYTSEDAKNIPPLLISQEGILIDGRHRLLALKYLEVEGITCEVKSCRDNLELTMEALKANVGGAKEMTASDIRKTIIDLLEQKYSRKKIISGLPFPKEMANKLYRDAAGHWNSLRVRSAVILVREGKASIEDASIQYDVSPLAVKKELSRIKTRGELRDSTGNLGAIKAVITQRYYRITKVNGQYIRKVVEQYELGSVDDVVLTEMMAHIEHQVRIHQSAMLDWKERLKTMVTTRAPLPKNMSPKKLMNELEDEE